MQEERVAAARRGLTRLEEVVNGLWRVWERWRRSHELLFLEDRQVLRSEHRQPRRGPAAAGPQRFHAESPACPSTTLFCTLPTPPPFTCTYSVLSYSWMPSLQSYYFSRCYQAKSQCHKFQVSFFLLSTIPLLHLHLLRSSWYSGLGSRTRLLSGHQYYCALLHAGDRIIPQAPVPTGVETLSQSLSRTLLTRASSSKAGDVSTPWTTSTRPWNCSMWNYSESLESISPCH